MGSWERMGAAVNLQQFIVPGQLPPAVLTGTRSRSRVLSPSDVTATERILSSPRLGVLQV